MSGTKSQATLLTDEERLAVLAKIIGKHPIKSPAIQLPSAAQYNQLSTDDDLQTLAKDMCRWLGFKPRSLTVSYADPQLVDDFLVSKDSIRINWLYRDHPYIVGALLVFAVLGFVAEHHNQPTDRSFLEFASIHSGLGLWVVNALRPKISRFESLYHAIDGAWFRREGLKLESYTAPQYAHLVASYAHDNRVEPEAIMPSITSRSRYLLPDYLTSKFESSLIDPVKIITHQRQARLMWAKIILLCLTVSLGTTIGVYLYTQKNPEITPAQIQDQQAVQIIKKSLDNCLQKASGQQSTYDPNDLFMTRQIDATKSHCQSLRNEYNFALDRYQKTYPKP
jgi:hypothetical protein